MNKPEMCKSQRLAVRSTWFTCWPGSVRLGYVYFASRSSLQRCLFPKWKSNPQVGDVQWIEIAVFWPAIIACLLGGTQKYNSRRIILFGIPQISNICIPTSSLCIVCCLCNFFFFFFSGGVNAIAIVLIAADESWDFEIISSSNEL